MVLIKQLELTTENIKSITDILTNHKLWALTCGQNLEDITEFELDGTQTYLGIYWGQELIGIFQYSSLTKVTLNGHINLLPNYWGTGASEEAISKAHEYLLKETNFKTVICTVPASCVHVLKFMATIKYKVCGAIPNGIVFDGHYRDLIIYSHSLI